MRLDHLLSKEEILSFVWNNPTKTEERSKEDLHLLFNYECSCTRGNKEVLLLELDRVSLRAKNNFSSKTRTSLRTKYVGGDALGGNTRSHPEHDG